MRRNLLVLTTVLFLAACASAPPHTATVIHPPPAPAPIVQPLTLVPVDWTAYTRSDLENLLGRIEADPGRIHLYAVSPDGMRAYALNLVEMHRYLQELLTVIAFYRKLSEDAGASQTTATE